MTALVLAPLRIEALALRGLGLDVRRTGMGRQHAVSASERHLRGNGAVVVAGFCGAVDPELEPGDAVVATAVRSADGELPCAPGELGQRLRDLGLRVATGTVLSAERILGPAERARLDGVVAVDMESYWVVEAAGDRPVAVVRVVVDRAGRRLLDPRTLPAGVRAFRVLRRAAPALAATTRSEPLRY